MEGNKRESIERLMLAMTKQTEEMRVKRENYKKMKEELRKMKKELERCNIKRKAEREGEEEAEREVEKIKKDGEKKKS